MTAHTALRRRPSRTVPATVVAVVLLAAGALSAVVGIARLVEGRWPTAFTTVQESATGASWGSTAVWAATVALAVVGLVLLVAALVPGSRRAVGIARQTPAATGHREVAMTTRGLARIAAAAADTVDGVDRVSVSAGPGLVRLRVWSGSRDDAALVRDRVQHVVTERLQQLGLQPSPRVRVALTVKES